MNDLVNEYKIPARGSVTLHSSSIITNFFITLFIILKSPAHLEGAFENRLTERFVDLLKEIGVDIEHSYSDINLNTSDISFMKQISILNYDLISYFYTSIILLDIQGSVEIRNIDENLDFINLCKYLGFKIVKSKNFCTIYNVIGEPKESLTFHENNLDYFLTSILLMLISNSNFVISTPQVDYNIAMVLDILKSLNLVKNVDFGTFVKIQFDKNLYEFDEKKNLEIPGDPSEFIFLIFLAAVTEGEIKILGANSKYYAETLKILSDLGIGFESISESEFKVWGTNALKSSKIIIEDDDPHLELTKLFLIPFTLNNSTSLETSVMLDSKKYKNFISDLNIIGAEIKVNDRNLIVQAENRIKSGDLYMNKNSEYENYAKLLFVLGNNLKINVKCIDNLLIYNSKILYKLNSLGLKLTYVPTK